MYILKPTSTTIRGQLDAIRRAGGDVLADSLGWHCHCWPTVVAEVVHEGR